MVQEDAQSFFIIFLNILSLETFNIIFDPGCNGFQGQTGGLIAVQTANNKGENNEQKYLRGCGKNSHLRINDIRWCDIPCRPSN
jgi:hypothetical protein